MIKETVQLKLGVRGLLVQSELSLSLSVSDPQWCSDTSFSIDEVIQNRSEAELLSMIGAGLILFASVSMSGRKLFLGKDKR